jgi:hypothetical protein
MKGKIKLVNANIYCNYIWNTLFQMLKKVEHRSFQSFGFESMAQRWTLGHKHLVIQTEGVETIHKVL